MLNAIRIILGLIMAYIAFATLFAVAIFSRGYSGQAAENGFIDLLLTGIAVMVPFISAWYLLFPKTRKQSYLGFALGLLFLAFAYSSQYF